MSPVKLSTVRGVASNKLVCTMSNMPKLVTTGDVAGDTCRFNCSVSTVINKTRGKTTSTVERYCLVYQVAGAFKSAVTSIVNGGRRTTKSERNRPTGREVVSLGGGAINVTYNSFSTGYDSTYVRGCGAKRLFKLSNVGTSGPVGAGRKDSSTSGC